jgi:hypothetical protein
MPALLSRFLRLVSLLSQVKHRPQVNRARGTLLSDAVRPGRTGEEPQEHLLGDIFGNVLAPHGLKGNGSDKALIAVDKKGEVLWTLGFQKAPKRPIAAR